MKKHLAVLASCIVIILSCSHTFAQNTSSEITYEKKQLVDDIIEVPVFENPAFNDVISDYFSFFEKIIVSYNEGKSDELDKADKEFALNEEKHLKVLEEMTPEEANVFSEFINQLTMSFASQTTDIPEEENSTPKDN